MRLFMSSKADLQNVPIPNKGEGTQHYRGFFFRPGIDFLCCEFPFPSFLCVYILRFFWPEKIAEIAIIFTGILST